MKVLKKIPWIYPWGEVNVSGLKFNQLNGLPESEREKIFYCNG